MSTEQDANEARCGGSGLNAELDGVLDTERYTEWYQCPFENGYWWRKTAHDINICWVKLRPDDESLKYHIDGTPLLYAHYCELGNSAGKIAIFEIETPGVSWQKVVPYNAKLRCAEQREASP